MKKQSRMMQGEQNRKTFVWMWQGIAGKRDYIVFLLIISVLLGMSGGLLALLLRNLIDHAVEGERSGFVAAGTGLVLLVILQITFRAVDRYLEEKTRSTYENIWKKRLFSELMGRSYREVTQIHSGEWMNRLTSDTVIVADGLAQIVPGVCGMLTRILIAVVLLIGIMPELAYVLIPGGLLLVFLTWIFRRVLKRLHKKVQEADGRLRIFLSERLSGLVILHTFVKEQETADEADRYMNAHQGSRMKKNRFSNIWVRCSNEWSLYSGSHILWVWNIERTGFLWNLYSSASACRTDPDTVCESVWVFPKIFCLPCQCRTADAGRNL